MYWANGLPLLILKAQPSVWHSFVFLYHINYDNNYHYHNYVIIIIANEPSERRRSDGEAAAE